ncbi:MAG: PorT family protein [Bacteroidetes bacterium]|nr:PorT family protein [Bacteroidota bacterium]MBS1776675.1 PorT family protein [Bacteroidota bacterium]MBS1782195.1 PorT family protein [Bacteroidota bacterium]
MAKVRKFAALIGFITSILPLLSKAQNPSNYYIEDPRTFYAGIIAGGNFTQVDGDNFAGYHKVGLNVGGIVYTHLGDHLAVSLEILFSQKGAKGNKEQGASTQQGSFLITQYKSALNYAEIPIQLCYFDKRRSHFGGGFSYSQLISAKETTVTNPNYPYNFEQYPFKKSDLNIVLGGNLHLVKGLFLNLRFQYSLISIRNNIPPGFGDRGQQFNNMWTARLMYLF